MVTSHGQRSKVVSDAEDEVDFFSRHWFTSPVAMLLPSAMPNPPISCRPSTHPSSEPFNRLLPSSPPRLSHPPFQPPLHLPTTPTAASPPPPPPATKTAPLYPPSQTCYTADSTPRRPPFPVPATPTPARASSSPHPHFPVNPTRTRPDPPHSRRSRTGHRPRSSSRPGRAAGTRQRRSGARAWRAGCAGGGGGIGGGGRGGL